MSKKQNISYIGDDKPYRIASRDISAYQRKQKKGHWGIVTPNSMMTKETTRLNRLLEINVLNMFGERMARRVE